MRRKASLKVKEVWVNVKSTAGYETSECGVLVEVNPEDDVTETIKTLQAKLRKLADAELGMRR